MIGARPYHEAGESSAGAVSIGSDKRVGELFQQHWIAWLNLAVEGRNIGRRIRRVEPRGVERIGRIHNANPVELRPEIVHERPRELAVAGDQPRKFLAPVARLRGLSAEQVDR